MPLPVATSKNTSRPVGTPADATLDDMGYRGEDVPATRGDWGRQTPWQPSSGAAPGSAGAWDDGSQGYMDDETYPPADGGSGYGPDGGYPGQGQQGYAAQDGQYGNAYGPAALRAAALRAVRRLRTWARVKRARAATAARRDTRSPTTTGTSTARTRRLRVRPGRLRPAARTRIRARRRLPGPEPVTASPPATRRLPPGGGYAEPRGGSGSYPALPARRAGRLAQHRAVAAEATRRCRPARQGGYQHRAVAAAATRRCRRAGRAATRQKTRATTGTAGSPPPRTARASPTPAPTGSTAGSSTSTAPARASALRDQVAAIRPEQASKGPARYPVP